MSSKPSNVRANAIADDVFRLNMSLPYEEGKALAEQIERAPGEGKIVVAVVMITDEKGLTTASPHCLRVWSNSQKVLDDFERMEADRKARG